MGEGECELMKKKQKQIYVPYKEYLWGFIRLKDGWKDLGLSKSFGKGEYSKYSYRGYSGEEEITYSSVCRHCEEKLRIGQEKFDKHVFYYCPKCKKIYNTRK